MTPNQVGDKDEVLSISYLKHIGDLSWLLTTLKYTYKQTSQSWNCKTETKTQLNLEHLQGIRYIQCGTFNMLKKQTRLTSTEILNPPHGGME